MFYAHGFSKRLDDPNAFYDYIEYANDNEYPELVEHTHLGLGAPYSDETREQAKLFASAISDFHIDMPSSLTNDEYRESISKIVEGMKSYVDVVKPGNTIENSPLSPKM